MHKGITAALGIAALAGTFELGGMYRDKVHSPDLDPTDSGELGEACDKVRDEATDVLLGRTNVARTFRREGTAGDTFAEINASIAKIGEIDAACRNAVPARPAPATPPTPPTTPGN